LNKASANIGFIIINYLSGCSTDADNRKLQEWLDTSPRHRRIFDEYQDIWQSSLKYQGTVRYNQETAWPGIEKQLYTKPSVFTKKNFISSRTFLKIAVSILFIGFISTSILFFSKKTADEKKLSTFSEYYVPLGSRSRIILPDGSTVWLNAGSKLRYNPDFNVKTRTVYLSGEGYFDVSKDKNKPFEISTRQALVKVLGTAFNVKAYPDENYVETTVERGKVQVFDQNRNEKQNLTSAFTLYPKQKLKINWHQPDKKTHQGANPNNKPDMVSTVMNHHELEENVNTQLYTSWKDERWIIKSETLQDLAVKIERRYNVTMTFKEKELKHYIFSGILTDETLEQVLEVIKLTAPIQYEVNQRNVVLTKRYLKLK
jgi:transmembrane sensor